MASRVRALALWCAVACAVASAAAYTIDCNHDYTDCEAEFGKLAINDGDPLLPLSSEIVTERAEPVEPITSTTSTTTTTTTSTTTTTQTPSTTSEPVTTTVEANEVPDSNSKPKPRLLNLNVDELQNFANILHNQTESKNSKKYFDLSDVDLDAENDEDTSLEHHEEKHIKIPDKFYSNLQEPFHPMLNVDRSDESETCIDNGITHKIGDKIDRGCDETCECTPGGQLECAPRCQSPFIRRGRRLNDPLCFESPVDECCSIIACATGNDAKTTSVEVCHYNNITYTVGSKWNVGCEQTCTCEKDSVVTCKPRCNRLPQSEKCINVQDPKDECCEVQVCDVSQDDHEEVLDNANSTTEAPKERNELAMEKSTMRPLVLIEPIGSIKVLHNNSVQVNLMHANNSDDPIHLQLSDNGGLTYDDIELKYSNLILNLKGGKNYILKTKETGTKFNFTITSTDGNEGPMEELKNKTKFGCYHDNKYYEVGEEFQIGCSEICECTGQDTKECAPMVCPSHVGLEIVSKSCVQWAPNPPPVPPNCCPRTARCLSDGTCHYKGVPVPNWSKVPIELTGCEEHCFCENGELDCQEVCSPLPPLPPQNLRCPPMHRPAPMNVSDEDCCKEWGCVPHDTSKPMFPVNPHSQVPFLPTVPPDNNHYPQEEIPDYDQNNVHRPVHPLGPALAGLPPGLHITSGDDNKRLSVLSLQGDSPTSIKMLFGLPSVLVGLKGSIDLRYTDTDDPDISQWYSQVFAPADEVLTTPRLEFRLTGLKPSTTYKIRGKLYLHSIPVEPESEILTVRTQDLPTIATVEEKRREIDCKLMVLDVNDTTAHLAWRHFTEDELMLIDGIQVRYRSTGSPLYSMTELLHHSRSTAELTDLRPGSTYEASLVLMPPPRATTELFDSGKVEFTTAPYIDPYNWTVEVEAREVGAEAVELTWRGVPMPAEKWVRVYRAAHDCGDRHDHDAFRLATRDSQPAITLTGLEADTKCRVWLDLFLTNGKVKTSNVLEIHTKSLDSPENIDNVIESSSIARGPARGDYYGALVVVGVVAALAALAAVLLLLVVVRRHRPRSVQITSPRESSLPPYDNPAYKLEIQQETMDL
ncbi:putative epidermal cell surface receptor isoform X2 [Aricia agestis]|uniref:putative epidermal cell surface receptor isoform X2 n=1 Tax=Aricia agestis TaxID=91739 RepID=UPI001C2084B9|nr:putative epidermal cell surface receptor isoform X2 [Aricia agestis]